MSEKVKRHIGELFVEMNGEIASIIRTSPTSAIATRRIME